MIYWLYLGLKMCEALMTVFGKNCNVENVLCYLQSKRPPFSLMSIVNATNQLFVICLRLLIQKGKFRETVLNQY